MNQPQSATHPITKVQVIAVLQVVIQIAAVFAFNIPDSISQVIIGEAGLVAVGLSWVEAHLLKGHAQAHALGQIADAVKDALPVVTSLTAAVPGPVGPEIHKALEDLQAAVDKIASAPPAQVPLPELEVTVRPRTPTADVPPDSGAVGPLVPIPPALHADSTPPAA